MLQWLSKIRFLKTATILGLFLVAVFFVFQSASAQSVADPNSPLLQGVTVIQEPLGLSSLDIRLIIARIIRVALSLVGIILVVLMIYAGYLWMTAGGNDEQITQAKSIIRNAVIGLAIILSAYSIVSYIIKILGVQDGGGQTTAVYAPGTQNFAGSGALGKAIKDHYPARNQNDVPRNTKIIITFNKPVLLSSFVDNSNNSVDSAGKPILGDCINTAKPTFNWFNDCDHIKLETNKLSDKFINVSKVDNGQSIQSLAVVANTSTINNITGYYTIVLKPITNSADVKGGYLGDPNGFVSYVVRLGNGILTDDSINNNPSIFQNQNVGNDFYNWQFTCSNILDISPPHVVNKFPAENSTEAKNSVIQVSFSEPMDPSGMQGSFSSIAGVPYYSLVGNKIFSKAPNSSVPLGSFSLVNNYQTLEFTPNKECGKNACGNPIYCLPVCDAPGANCPVDNNINFDNYQMLLTAAKTFAGSFESIPFTGLADMSGNALDGNNDGNVQTATTTLPVFDNWKQPDNFSWPFKIKNQIDATSPYIKKITPGVGAQNVPKDALLSLEFSKRMRAESAYKIEIQEYPVNPIPMWTVPFVHTDTYQVFDIKHAPFLDAKKQNYIPIVNSSVEDVNFNCFYPGVGPKDVVPDGSQDSQVCDLVASPEKCCAVIDDLNSAFCCNGAVFTSVDGIKKCIDDIKVNNS